MEKKLERAVVLKTDRIISGHDTKWQVALYLALFLGLFFCIFQNSYALKRDLSWKDVKSKFKWTTANVLWCRYKTPSGHLFENAGRTIDKKSIMTYAYSEKEKKYFWSCPDVNDPLQNRHPCPHLLTDGRYNYSNSWFLIDDENDPSIRTQFVQDAQSSCIKYTPHDNYEFVEYGIKSTADFLNTLFHKPLFGRIPDLGKRLPFSRIVVFGDSLTDTGNSFGTLAYPQWPYFIGRFSNGPVWVEYIAQRLIENEASQFDLYNYAIGGGGVTNPSYNPFGIYYKQVQSYLDIMKQGSNDRLLEPGYESTLFIVFIGSNDYMVLTQNNGLLEKLLYCSQGEPKKCAKHVVDGIVKEIEKILISTKNKAKYFLIPVQPDVTLAPYYQKLDPNNKDDMKEKTFISEAIKAHNIYLAEGLLKLEKKHPQIKILRLNLRDIIANMVENPDNKIVNESNITNTKDACFSGSAKNLKNKTFCNNPESYMFWDSIHLTTTTNCDLAEYAVSEIYKAFGNKENEYEYMPQYKLCRGLNDITHDLLSFKPQT